MSNFLINGSQSFGRLTTVFPFKSKDSAHLKWACVCSCGKSHIVRADHLHNHNIRSCGCLQRESKITHGLSRTRSYRSWSLMKARCSNKNVKRYAEYIDRGITVCERWMEFEKFLADMGEKPEGKSLDRIDNNKGYSPDNCRWATSKEQMNNTRGNRWITYKSELKRLHEWALIAKVSTDTFRTRLRRGWTIERALAHPLNVEKKEGR